MLKPKERTIAVVEVQPDDSSYEETMRAVLFDRMVARGMADVRANRVIDDNQIVGRIAQWRG